MGNPFGRVETRKNIRRGNQSRYGGMRYCIEGEYVNIEEMALRVGVSFDTMRVRHKREVAKAGPVTWHGLETV